MLLFYIYLSSHIAHLILVLADRWLLSIFLSSMWSSFVSGVEISWVVSAYYFIECCFSFNSTITMVTFFSFCFLGKFSFRNGGQFVHALASCIPCRCYIPSCLSYFYWEYWHRVFYLRFLYFVVNIFLQCS